MVSSTAIRGATESETFDLGGQTTTTIEKLIRDAFEEPFALTEMIRITFVTGAGKQARAKYDADAGMFGGRNVGRRLLRLSHVSFD